MIEEVQAKLELWEKERRAELERLLAEAEAAEAGSEHEPSEPEERKPRRGHGPNPQTGLRRVKKVFELPEDDRSCTLCGGTLEEMGDQAETSEMVDVIALEYVIKQVERKKYRCRCNGCVKTAPGPLRAIPGGRYSLDFALQVAEDKYLDHLPLERQVRRMERLGLEVTSQTLYDQIEALVDVLRPTYDAIGELALGEPVLHADETRWPRLDGKGKSNWTVWGRCSHRLAHYAILGSKSHKTAKKLFRGYEGVLVADGYQVYEALVRDGPRMQLANCWAHVRRKFGDIQAEFPSACGFVLTRLKRLYEIEAEVPGPFPGDAEAQRLRARLRESKSKPILDELKEWMTTAVGLPQSALGQAVRYTLKRWDALNVFVTNPLVPMDNNAAERALRNPVVGRKNHYGSKSKRGTEVAALFYTLYETARLSSALPTSYVKAATERALETPGAVTFPWDLEDEIQDLIG